MRPVSFFLAALVFSATGPAWAAEESAWRLFVADHAEPKVSVIDLHSGELLETFALAGPASLYTTPSKKAVFAVQGDADQVAAFSTGIAVEDHGDHGDLTISDPALIDTKVTGDYPVHFVEHDGQIAIFFDREGVTRILSERDWLAGKVDAKEWKAEKPHHGVAVQLGDFVMISEPHPQDLEALPVGMQVLDARGEKLGDLHACPDLHGEAASGDTLAIACGSGLLLVKESADGPDVQFLPYADSLPEGKATTLLGGVGLQYFLGNYGADRVVLIDPSSEDAFRLVDLPTRRVHFAVNPQDVKFAYVFTEDGQLRELNVLSGELTRSLAVTEPYSIDGAWNLPRPRIAVADGEIAVTDPAKGAIHVIDADTFAEVRQIAVDGAPFNIVAVGGTGESHAH